jgi:transcriptional regulator with XRE-family HTH domain
MQQEHDDSMPTGFDAAPALKYAGTLLKARREALVDPPMSQTALAAQLGITVGAISRIEAGQRVERGRAWISIGVLLHWVEILGLTMGDLFPKRPNPHVAWFMGLCPEMQASTHDFLEQREQYLKTKRRSASASAQDCADKK